MSSAMLACPGSSSGSSSTISSNSNNNNVHSSRPTTAQPGPLTQADLRCLTGYLSSVYSIATLRLSWLVGLPRLQVLSNEHLYYAGYVPCRRAQVLGLIVGMSATERRVLYTVDDGSGAIVECLCWTTREKERRPGWAEEHCFQVGQIVSVMGKIEEYREARQLNVESIDLERDSNAESRHMLRCAMLQRTKYQHPFSIAAEMARVTQIHQEDSSFLHQDSVSSCTSNAADFSSASYASSDPLSESSYASFHRSNMSFLSNISATTTRTRKSPRKLQKPSHIPDRDLNDTTLRIYVFGYFQRHPHTPCSAQSLNANEALRRLAQRIGDKRTKVLRSKITNFARSSHKSSSQEDKKDNRQTEREELNLRLFREALGALVKDGLVVPCNATQTSTSKTAVGAGGRPQIFYNLFHLDLLKPVLTDLMQQMLCVGSPTTTTTSKPFSTLPPHRQEAGLSESTIVAEVKEVDLARWHYINPKEVRVALDSLALDPDCPVQEVNTGGTSGSRWVWSASSQ